jgi:hypothetical protein
MGNKTICSWAICLLGSNPAHASDFVMQWCEGEVDQQLPYRLSAAYGGVVTFATTSHALSIVTWHWRADTVTFTWSTRRLCPGRTVMEDWSFLMTVAAGLVTLKLMWTRPDGVRTFQKARFMTVPCVSCSLCGCPLRGWRRSSSKN